MEKISGMSAAEALERLKRGSEAYLDSLSHIGDVSPALRKRTAEEGQSPFAVIVACSDSRVMPECIFSAGIGELFVIRVAGNVVGEHELGSIEYAVTHLGCGLVVVLGHTHCGAVDAALHHRPEGHIGSLTDEIRLAAGSETDENRVCELNVRHGAERIRRCLAERHGNGGSAARAEAASVLGAVYDIESGRVEFLEEL